jgi:hypothetical protein
MAIPTVSVTTGLVILVFFPQETTATAATSNMVVTIIFNFILFFPYGLSFALCKDCF